MECQYLFIIYVFVKLDNKYYIRFIKNNKYINHIIYMDGTVKYKLLFN